MIDIGNTNIKYAFFEENVLAENGVVENLEGLEQLMAQSQYKSCVIGSVRYSKDEIEESLNGRFDYLFVDDQTPLPIKINYDTPKTLGVDRIAAVIGGWDKFPGHAIMVIDIGTCITYDLLDSDGIYQGGAISPGLDLKFKAINDYTARLPLVESATQADLFGKSTYDSIKSGIINGTQAEIEGMISQFLLKMPDLKVIITGGGAKTFETKIKADIFVALEIVLVGLNRVLNYNAQ